MCNRTYPPPMYNHFIAFFLKGLFHLLRISEIPEAILFLELAESRAASQYLITFRILKIFKFTTEITGWLWFDDFESHVGHKRLDVVEFVDLDLLVIEPERRVDSKPLQMAKLRKRSFHSTPPVFDRPLFATPLKYFK